MKLPLNDYLIAEIGGNHEGNIDWALDMIADAASAGANAVKFQSYSAEQLVNQKLDETRFNHFNNFVLNENEWNMLKEKALNCGVDFLTSIWDIESFRYLLSEMPIIKVGSGDLTNYKYLKEFSSTGKPIILSTAMADLKEIKSSVSFVQECNPIYNSKDFLCLMHCVAMYGDPKESYANLNSISLLQNNFPKLNIGYSDHTLGFEAMLIAKSMGVNIFEFHFTFDKSRDFRDHHISLNKEDLIEFKHQINRINIFKGNNNISPVAQIETPKRITEFRRACFFNRKMKKDEIIYADDITVLRPNIGIPASKFPELIGKKLVIDVNPFEPLSMDYFES
tara:strand:+ start:2473 stop:3483 length:1011 start_codon:yes stop_codon:yes gene_type:complete